MEPHTAGTFPISARGRRSRSGGFTLVEVLLALGLLSFAIISMVGLLSVGLTGMQGNIQRSVEAQIMDWVRSTAQVAHTEGTLLSLAEDNPHPFDQAGLLLAASHTGVPIYSATLTPVQKPLPGSEQTLWGIQVVIRSPARGDRALCTNALWFSK